MALEKRTAKARPKVPVCSAISFRSTIGPTTMNVSRATGEKPDSEAATKASASEHTASSTASAARNSTDSQADPAKVSSTDRGTATLKVAAAMAPTTRNPPACSRSCWKPARNSAQRLCPGRCPVCRTDGRSHSSLPSHSHSQPMAQAAAREATSRASTISGRPGKATAVAVRTIGLTAGADSRNANAAAGVTPRPIRLLATGTDAHSHPGSTTPATPATGTASAPRRGSTRWNTEAGTKALIAPESAVPRRRKGSACTQTARHTVRHARTAGASIHRPRTTSAVPGSRAAPSSRSGQCRGHSRARTASPSGTVAGGCCVSWSVLCMAAST